MTKHTQGRWLISSSFLVCDEKVRIIANCSPLGFSEDISPDAFEAQANARLIVRACNSHDKLLAACKGALEFIQNGIEFGYIKMPDENSKDTALLIKPLLQQAIQSAEVEG